MRNFVAATVAATMIATGALAGSGDSAGSAGHFVRERARDTKLSDTIRSPKCILIYELAKAWTDGTSEKAGISGSTTWELPKTPFSNFAKASILMLPSTTEFESGFAELLRRSIKVSKPTK